MKPIVARKYRSRRITLDNRDEYSWVAFWTRKITTRKTRLIILKMRLSEDPKKLLVGVRDSIEKIGIEFSVPIATAMISETRTVPTAVPKRRRPY